MDARNRILLMKRLVINSFLCVALVAITGCNVMMVTS